MEFSNKDILILSLIKGIGPQTIKAIINGFKNIDELKTSSIEFIKNSTDKRSCNKILDLINNKEGLLIAQRKADTIINNCITEDIKIISLVDEFYPKNLSLIKDSPPVLFVRGNEYILKNNLVIAVVGTRDPTDRGIQITQEITEKYTDYGFTIVSGLALGIDTIAHKSCLSKNGNTIAVLGTSIDSSYIYPKENISLFHNIIENKGLIISELPPGHKAEQRDFAKRDRIQSGLSAGVFAIESDIAGGTMQTINYAQKQGRPIFAPKPINIDTKQSKGISRILYDLKIAFEIRDNIDYPIIAKLLTNYIINVLNNQVNSDYVISKIENELYNTDKLTFDSKINYFRNIFNIEPLKEKKESANKGMIYQVKEKEMVKIINNFEIFLDTLLANDNLKDPMVKNKIFNILKNTINKFE